MRLLKKTLRVLLWPFRLWRLGLALLLLLVAAQIILDQWLLRRLAIQAEQIRNARRPVTYADLNLPQYTVIDNAFALYEQAINLIQKEPAVLTGDTTPRLGDNYALLINRYVNINPCMPKEDDQPLSADELAQLGNYLQCMQPAFDLIRQSRDCHTCVIPDFVTEIGAINTDNKTNAILLKGLAWMRELTRYTAAKGLWEYRQGNPEAAFDWFAIGLNIANNHRSHPTLIGALNGIGCLNTVLNAVQQALYDGDIPAELPAAFHAELRKWNEPGAYAQTFENERLYIHEQMVRQGYGAWRVLRPLFSLDQLKVNQLCLELADTVRTADFGQQQTAFDALRDRVDTPLKNFCITHKILFPAMLRSVESIRHSNAVADLCETALRLKQFRQKTGAYPEALSAMDTPLLADPFSGLPLQYERNGQGFRLISAGKATGYQGETMIKTNLEWCTVQ